MTIPTAVSAASSGRRTLKKASVKSRILEAARATFIADGIDDADLAAIARRAKVGRATLYRYFDGRDALLIALMEEDWDKQAIQFQHLVNLPNLNLWAIQRWLRNLVRAIRARASSLHFFRVIGQEAGMMARLLRQRRKLMDILGTRFDGFSGSAPSDRVAGFLILLQIEGFTGHVATSDDEAETEAGIKLISRQLMRQFRLPL
jgi:AcrR family transcriptional regulator